MLEPITWPISKLARVFSPFPTIFPGFQEAYFHVFKFPTTNYPSFRKREFPITFARFSNHMSHLRVDRTFFKIFTNITFFYLGLSFRKISKPSFNWIWKKRYTTFWAQFGVDMLHFLTKRKFLEICFIAIFIYLLYLIIVQNFKISPLSGFQEVVVKAPRFNLG